MIFISIKYLHCCYLRPVNRTRCATRKSFSSLTSMQCREGVLLCVSLHTTKEKGLMDCEPTNNSKQNRSCFFRCQGSQALKLNNEIFKKKFKMNSHHPHYRSPKTCVKCRVFSSQNAMKSALGDLCSITKIIISKLLGHLKGHEKHR